MSEAGNRVPVVAAVVRQGDCYLVCRRPSHKRHGGLWEFPGGKVRRDETHTDAVRRELTEELGLDALEVGPALFTATDEGAPFVIEFVETQASGTPVLHEHTEVGWFEVEALLELPLAPADARFVAWLDGRDS